MREENTQLKKEKKNEYLTLIITEMQINLVSSLSHPGLTAMSLFSTDKWTKELQFSKEALTGSQSLKYLQKMFANSWIR